MLNFSFDTQWANRVFEESIGERSGSGHDDPRLKRMQRNWKSVDVEKANQETKGDVG